MAPSQGSLTGVWKTARTTSFFFGAAVAVTVLTTVDVTVFVTVPAPTVEVTVTVLAIVSVLAGANVGATVQPATASAAKIITRIIKIADAFVTPEHDLDFIFSHIILIILA